MTDNDDWLDPDDDMGIWEHQGRPLTTAALVRCLSNVATDVPVTFEHYDGNQAKELRAMHIDLRGAGGTVTSLVVTLVSS